MSAKSSLNRATNVALRSHRTGSLLQAAVRAAQSTRPPPSTSPSSRPGPADASTSTSKKPGPLLRPALLSTPPPPRRSTTIPTDTSQAGSSGETTNPSVKELGKDKGKDVPKTPPSLPRPPGIAVEPVASDKTYEVKDNSMERRKEERSYLLREANKGYFHDYNSASKSGGKLWIAPKVLIREDRARYMPNIAGVNLLNNYTNTTELCKGKTSVVAFTSTRLAEEHITSFMDAVLKDQEGKEDFNFVQINHQTNYGKAFLLSMLKSSLKRTVPEERWGQYILAKGEWSQLDVSGPLGYDNKIIGYVYLVDSNCKIRWAGCGNATEEEVKSLRTATEVLMKRSRAV